MELSYSGKAYNGWQIQNNAPSVQQTLQEALSTILRVPTEWSVRDGRIRGVHAARYVAHFDAECPLEEPQRFCYHLNAILPWDIAVQDVRRVRDDAHARFDAVEREYKYYVSPRKDPFRRDVAYQLIMPLDLDRMNEAAETLLGRQDFTSFSKLHSGNKTNICRVTRAQWREQDGCYVLPWRPTVFYAIWCARLSVRCWTWTRQTVGRRIPCGDRRARPGTGGNFRSAAGVVPYAGGLSG